MCQSPGSVICSIRLYLYVSLLIEIFIIYLGFIQTTITLCAHKNLNKSVIYRIFFSTGLRGGLYSVKVDGCLELMALLLGFIYRCKPVFLFFLFEALELRVADTRRNGLSCNKTSSRI